MRQARFPHKITKGQCPKVTREVLGVGS